MTSLRMRQICLVASELEPIEDDLSAIFDIVVCHRDPHVERFGLHNALFAVSTCFIEIVSPLRDDTAAGRYLEKRHGDGGYMVILDTQDMDAWRKHVVQCGVRIAAPLQVEQYEGIQLHPRDTGGALLEINSTKGGHDLSGPYWPAGPHWQKYVRTHRVKGMTGAVLQSDDPQLLAQRWASILQRPAWRRGDTWLVRLDNATLRFTATRDGRGEGLEGIDLDVCDAPAILAAARVRERPFEDAAVEVGGVWFRWGQEDFNQA